MKSSIRIAVALLALTSSRIAAADDGAALYTKHCTMCHGADGKGQTGMGKKLHAKDWTDGTTLAAMSDADVTKVITAGKGRMGKFAKLGNDPIQTLVAFVRTLQRCAPETPRPHNTVVTCQPVIPTRA